MTAERIALATLMVTAYLVVVVGFLVWSIRRHRREARWDRWLVHLHQLEDRKADPDERTNR